MASKLNAVEISGTRRRLTLPSSSFDSGDGWKMITSERILDGGGDPENPFVVVDQTQKSIEAKMQAIIDAKKAAKCGLVS